MKRNLLLTFAAALLFAVANSGEQKLLPPGSATPSYKLKDARSGKMVDLQSYKGKYKAIVLDFFASWCGPCQKGIPSMISMHNKYKGKGVLVIGVDVWDEWKDMQDNIKAKKMPYVVLHDPAQKGGLAQKFGIEGIPAVFILDGKTMKVKANYEGFSPSIEKSRMAEQTKVLNSLGVK